MMSRASAAPALAVWPLLGTGHDLGRVVRPFRAIRIERIYGPPDVLECKQTVVAARHADPIAWDLVLGDVAKSGAIMDSGFQNQVALCRGLDANAAEATEVVWLCVARANDDLRATGVEHGCLAHGRNRAAPHGHRNGEVAIGDRAHAAGEAQ